MRWVGAALPVDGLVGCQETVYAVPSEDELLASKSGDKIFIGHLGYFWSCPKGSGKVFKEPKEGLS